MTVQELIDELMKVEYKSKEVIYWNFGYCGVDNVDDDEIGNTGIIMELKIGELL